MISVTTFLKDWLGTVKDIVLTPGKFFSGIKGETGLNRPFWFALTTIFFESLLSVISVLAFFAPKQTLSWLVSPSFDNSFLLSIIILLVIFLYSFLSSLISLPVYAVISHVLLKICGAHGSFNDTLRISCYYMGMTIVISPVSIALIPIISLANTGAKTSELFLYSVIVPAVLIILGFVVYSFYILFTGFSVVHGISKKRVFAAVIGIPLVIMILFVAMVVALIFVTGYSGSTTFYGNRYPVGDQPSYSAPVDHVISAPYGTAPQVDGYYTSDDIWGEAEMYYFTSSRINYTIAAKHDGTMLYILIRWKGGEEWDNPLNLYFEQDGTSHDHDLTTGRNDVKHNSASNYYFDAYGDMEMNEQKDGRGVSGFNNDTWVYEWSVPLCSQDAKDICVDKFPATLGFMVDIGNENIRFPDKSTGYRSDSWGDLEIIDVQ